MLLSEAAGLMVAACCRTLSRRSRIAAMSSPCRETLRSATVPDRSQLIQATPPLAAREASVERRNDVSGSSFGRVSAAYASGPRLRRRTRPAAPGRWARRVVANSSGRSTL